MLLCCERVKLSRGTSTSWGWGRARGLGAAGGEQQLDTTRRISQRSSGQLTPLSFLTKTPSPSSPLEAPSP